MMPSGPSATAPTAPPSATMEKTISDRLATSRGLSAQRIPDLISVSAFSRVRFQPVTVYPAARSRGTIPAPMAPSPTNPIIIGGRRPASPRSCRFTVFSIRFAVLGRTAEIKFRHRRAFQQFFRRAFKFFFAELQHVAAMRGGQPLPRVLLHHEDCQAG